MLIIYITKMNNLLLNIIICPNCHYKLIYKKKKSALICNKEKIFYKIYNSIPILIKEKSNKTI